MASATLADAVFLLHLLFIAFAAFGAALVYYWHRLIWLHLPALLWAVLISLFGWICPLTPLENYFLELAGNETYQGGFIAYYLEPIIYPAGLTREMQIALAGGLCVYNALVYGFYYYQRRSAT